MNEDPTRELPKQSFEDRVLAELAAILAEQAATRTGVDAIRAEVDAVRAEVDAVRAEVDVIRTEQQALRAQVDAIQVQQGAMARNIIGLDERLTSLEETVDARLKETRPIWEAVQAQIEKLDEKFDLMIRDLYDVRGDVALHAKRISLLEQRPTP